jgi:hypothetical protein
MSFFVSYQNGNIFHKNDIIVDYLKVSFFWKRYLLTSMIRFIKLLGHKVLPCSVLQSFRPSVIPSSSVSVHYLSNVAHIQLKFDTWIYYEKSCRSSSNLVMVRWVLTKICPLFNFQFHGSTISGGVLPLSLCCVYSTQT